MICVGIADDHDIVREGVRRILESHKDLKVVWMAGNGRETLELLRKEFVDVLVLDLDMPDMDGLDVTKQAIPVFPDLKILILTMHDDEEYAERVMKAGASGYVLKDSSPNELPGIVMKIARGGMYIQPSISEKTALKLYRQRKRGHLSNLSDRELQILKKLATGMKQKKIAEELNLSTGTVATHKKRMMEKLGLRKNVDIIRFAINNNLVV